MSRNLKTQYFLFKLRAGRDPEVFVKLYDIYVDQIYRFVYLKVSSKEEAEDLTAEVFLKTWQYIQEMGAGSIDNLQAFLYQTARNAIIDFYRTKGRESVSLNLEKQDEEGNSQLKMELVDEKQDVLEKIELSSDIEEVKKALQKIKEEYQEVVVLRFIEEMSVRETAEILGKSEGAVRVLLHRAIGALRKETGTVAETEIETA